LSLVVMLAVFTIRTAWMCDEAFLTLRTIDNWISGAGLSWNPGVRVQVHTHPLWLFSLAGPYFVFREPYFTTLALSLLFGLTAVALFAFRVARALGSAVFVLLVFSMSDAVVSYTTSGLENPLTHLLLVTGYLVTTSARRGPWQSWSAGMLLGGLLLTAPLAVILVLPQVLWFWVGDRRAGWWIPAGFGLVPAAAWFMFALAYYGSPLSTPTVAWLNDAVPLAEASRQGLAYLAHSIGTDPWSATLVALAIALGAFRADRTGALMLAGLVLALVAVVATGGDSLGGRALSPVVLWSGMLLARAPIRMQWPLVYATGIAVTGAVALGAPPRTWAYGQVFPRIEGYAAIGPAGVVDGRTFFHMATGLTNWSRSTGWRTSRWAVEARTILASSSPQLFVTGLPGILGYLAGPRVYVWDPYGNLDPVVARLPGSPRWRPRTTPRAIPEGYRRLVESGQAFEFSAPQREFVANVRLLAAEDLMAPGRWRAILELGLVGGPAGEGQRQVPLHDALSAPGSGVAWDADGVTSWTGFSVDDDRYAPRGIVFDLPPRTARRLEVFLSGNDDYVVDLYLQSSRVRRFKIGGSPSGDGRLVPYSFGLGANGVRFNRVAVIGRRGDFRYAIGRVQLH
jgi:arabinofuranosyltransferase